VNSAVDVPVAESVSVGLLVFGGDCVIEGNVRVAVFSGTTVVLVINGVVCEAAMPCHTFGKKS
jgi:hypothetical protein